MSVCKIPFLFSVCCSMHHHYPDSPYVTNKYTDKQSEGSSRETLNCVMAKQSRLPTRLPRSICWSRSSRQLAGRWRNWGGIHAASKGKRTIQIRNSPCWQDRVCETDRSLQPPMTLRRPRWACTANSVRDCSSPGLHCQTPSFLVCQKLLLNCVHCLWAGGCCLHCTNLCITWRDWCKIRK